MHALLTRHYMHGGYYPVGGSSVIAAAIAPLIEATGGEVHFQADVDEILIRNGRAVGVRMIDGREITAPVVVSDAGVHNTFLRLLPKGIARRGSINNFLGTDATGASAVGGRIGVEIRGCDDNHIGSGTVGESNVISGHDSHGVSIRRSASGGTPSVDNEVLGNLIGVAVDGVTPLGNENRGMNMEGDADYTWVGGTTAGDANVIAYNGWAGVAVSGDDSNGNQVRGNVIHSNDGLGIDLRGLNGVDPNDDGAGDSDTGPNGLQNYPVITNADPDSDTVTLTLDSSPSTLVVIEVFASLSCDSTGFGEGATLIDAAAYFTNASGMLTATINASDFQTGSVITAAASSGIGGTSEFSECFSAGGTDLVFADGFESGNTSAWSSTTP